MKKEKTLIYIVYEAGNFQSALELCIQLKDRRGIQCILYSPYYLPKTEEYKEIASQSGLVYLHEVTALGGEANLAEQLKVGSIEVSTVPQRLQPPPKTPFRVSLVKKFAKDHMDAFSYWQAYYLNRIAFIENILHQLSASYIVLPEDNVERDSACWISAIQKKGGKACVISYASITPHEAAIAYWSNADYAVDGLVDRMLTWVMPQWRYVHNGKAMLRLPAARALAMESLQLAPKHPWVVNTGKMNRVLVESRFMRNMFVEKGVLQVTVEVTGTLPLDRLAQTAAKPLINHDLQLKKLGCDPGRKTVVCAFPPNQYPNLRATSCPNFSDLVTVFIDGLKSVEHQFNIIISPHPSLSVEDIQLIESKSVNVYRGNLMDIVALADLYVASVSTTIKWALACGVPVVNYDCYRYLYDDFFNLPQVLECAEAEDYAETMLRFLDYDFYQAQEKIAKNHAAEFGVLDGKSIDRIEAAIFE